MTGFLIFVDLVEADEDARLFDISELAVYSRAERTHRRGEGHVGVDERRYPVAGGAHEL